MHFPLPPSRHFCLSLIALDVSAPFFYPLFELLQSCYKGEKQKNGLFCSHFKGIGLVNICKYLAHIKNEERW